MGNPVSRIKKVQLELQSGMNKVADLGGRYVSLWGSEGRGRVGYINLYISKYQLGIGFLYIFFNIIQNPRDFLT